MSDPQSFDHAVRTMWQKRRTRELNAIIKRAKQQGRHDIVGRAYYYLTRVNHVWTWRGGAFLRAERVLRSQIERARAELRPPIGD